jgi:hypothetical protein
MCLLLQRAGFIDGLYAPARVQLYVVAADLCNVYIGTTHVLGTGKLIN